MSPHLQAIRACVANLVDHIEAAAHMKQDPDSSWLERHPLAFAAASLGIELLGWRLIEKARRRRAELPSIWWLPTELENETIQN